VVCRRRFRHSSRAVAVTLLIVDVASYQGALSLADVRRAGFGAVNFKTSHGLGIKSVHPHLATLAAQARTVGLARSSFHWLTADPGAAQADHAYARLVAAGLDWGCPHFVDCEADAPLPVLSAYVARMRELLGRPVGLYTGGWWWRPRKWNGAALSPYLASAPDSGYGTGYPGDESPLWAVSWGGWAAISVLQYEVNVLRFPDGSSGKIRVSKSAVRDLSVWAALSGGQMTSPVCIDINPEDYAGPELPDPWDDEEVGWGDPDVYRPAELVPELARGTVTPRGGQVWVLVKSLAHVRTQFNTAFPNRDKTSDGSIGDQAHQTSLSGHNPDEEGHSETTDADTVNEVRAIDVDADLRKADVTMEMVVQHLVTLCRTGKVTFLRYIIFNGRIWKKSAGWVTQAYKGKNKHDKHAHLSCEPDTASENATPDLGLAKVGVKPAPPKPPAAPPKPPTLAVHAPGSRTIKQGAKGTDVQFVQRFIGPERCGPATGVFDAKTLAGVKWYQKMRGLTPDGIVGPKTWKAMGR
jgi:hypothetical protein